MTKYDAIIVGGGPAGSSAAIHLSSLGLRVLLLEKDAMPRDKLCGEFLSTEVNALCRRLGVLDRMLGAGANPIHVVRTFAQDGASFEAKLSGIAYGLSRRTFDELLFRRAGECGAEIREREAVRRIEGNLQDGFEVETERQSFYGRVVIAAYGRRSTLDRKLSRGFMKERSHFVAFKAHFVGGTAGSAIELHAFPGGYCGLLTEETGETNICWMAYSDALRRAGGTPEGMASSALRANRTLAGRLDRLERVQDYLAVGELVFRSKGHFASDVCMIGDAAGMIAPLCGDGMAMALTTGEIVSPLIHDFLSGDSTAREFKQRYADHWNRQFRRRMVLGRHIQTALLSRRVSGFGIRACAAVPALAEAVVRATRG
ncbi:MAG: FAD-dependent monooxygenase [Rhodothermales bacterium]